MNQERIYKVLLGPHVSEKSAMSAEAGNQVVFRVLPSATKLEIKNAVEKLFKVDVVDVRTVNMKGKVKRNRFGLSKKAKLEEGLCKPGAGSRYRLCSR